MAARPAVPAILESVLSDSKGLRRHFGSLSPLDRAIELVESWPPLADLLALYCRVLVPGLGDVFACKTDLTHVCYLLNLGNSTLLT
jgi:hypothetical protein